MRVYIPIYLVSFLYSCSGDPAESKLGTGSNNFDFAVTYYQDSTIKETAQRKNGLLEGKAFKFNEDGTKQLEFNFKNDQQEGIQYYYIYGRLSFEVLYTNGIRNGWAKRYGGPCGRVSEEGNYVEDKMNGLWYEYYDDELLEISSYKDDSLVEVLYRNKKYPDRNLPLPPIVRDCNEIWKSGEE